MLLRRICVSDCRGLRPGPGYSRAPRAGIPSARGRPPVCEQMLRPSPGFAVTVRDAMVRRRRQDDAVPEDVTELAALADGSLEPERRAALEARVAASAELAARLAEQHRAVMPARSAAAE